jgi:hypothetical protein
LAARRELFDQPASVAAARTIGEGDDRVVDRGHPRIELLIEATGQEADVGAADGYERAIDRETLEGAVLHHLLEPGGDMVMADVTRYEKMDPIAVWMQDSAARREVEPFWRESATRDLAAAEYQQRPTGTAAATLLAAGARLETAVQLVDPGGNAVGFELDVCLVEAGSTRCANDIPRTTAAR